MSGGSRWDDAVAKAICCFFFFLRSKELNEKSQWVGNEEVDSSKWSKTLAADVGSKLICLLPVANSATAGLNSFISSRQVLRTVALELSQTWFDSIIKVQGDLMRLRLRSSRQLRPVVLETRCGGKNFSYFLHSVNLPLEISSSPLCLLYFFVLSHHCWWSESASQRLFIVTLDASN